MSGYLSWGATGNEGTSPGASMSWLRQDGQQVDKTRACSVSVAVGISTCGSIREGKSKLAPAYGGRRIPIVQLTNRHARPPHRHPRPSPFPRPTQPQAAPGAHAADAAIRAPAQY